MSDIYICASNIDRDIVLPAVEALEQAGYVCCVPGRDFDFGLDWKQSIADAINSSTLALYFDSDAARRSFRIATELEEIEKSGLMKLTTPVGSFTHESLTALVKDSMDEALRIREDVMTVLPYEGGDPYIFVSFAEADRDRVFTVLRGLAKRGYRLWFIGGGEPGAERDEMIAEHLERASYMIPFFSAVYFEDENCKDELSFARELGLEILPVYIEDAVLPAPIEMRFGRRQALFWHKYTNKEDFFRKIDEANGIDNCRA